MPAPRCALLLVGAAFLLLTTGPLPALAKEVPQASLLPLNGSGMGEWADSKSATRCSAPGGAGTGGGAADWLHGAVQQRHLA